MTREITNNLVLRHQKPPCPNQNGMGVSDYAQRDNISKIRNTLISALKIITIAMLASDNISAEFFSNFDNYSKLFSSAIELKLTSKKIDETIREKFNLNPVELWMEFIVIIFTSLYMLPENSIIYCDNIGESEKKNNSKTDEVGVYFSSAIILEAYDWKTHKIDLFIPSDNKKYRMMFIIDDEPVLFC